MRSKKTPPVSPVVKTDLRETMDAILNFGADSALPSKPSSINDRLLQLVKDLKELNRRIDKLMMKP